MAFCFKRKESVANAVSRLGRTRIKKALECLEDCHQTEAIHCVRKEIKKARAVLRLTRTGIKKKEYRRLSKLLRGAADHLSPVRDAHVKTAALKILLGHFKGQLAPRALSHLRTALHTELREETNQFDKRKAARAVQRLLRRAAKEFDQLKLGAKGWQALMPGVKAAYSQGRQAHFTALKHPSPEIFHAWRKRVKDLWYHMRVLQPVWPEQMEATTDELEMLGGQLGDDHDLFLLQQAAKKHCTQNGNHELEALRGLIEERQRELRAAALALGARLYAEKPSPFSDRLGRYWRLWRSEKQNACAQATNDRPA